MKFLCFGNKNNKSILFIHGTASTAMLCYKPLLKQLPDYYVILAEVDGHSEQTDELISLEKNCDEIENYKGTVLFWRGSNERYPKKSAALLKKYLPDLIDVEIENMGHGQYLHEHSDEYADKLIGYLSINRK